MSVFPIARAISPLISPGMFSMNLDVPRRNKSAVKSPFALAWRTPRPGLKATSGQGRRSSTYWGVGGVISGRREERRGRSPISRPKAVAVRDRPSVPPLPSSAFLWSGSRLQDVSITVTEEGQRNRKNEGPFLLPSFSFKRREVYYFPLDSVEVGRGTQDPTRD